MSHIPQYTIQSIVGFVKLAHTIAVYDHITQQLKNIIHFCSLCTESFLTNPHSRTIIFCAMTQQSTVNIFNYIMAGHAIVVVKDITLLFHHGNAVILTLWYWLNDEKWFVWCKFNYINNHLWLVKNNNHLKPRYTEPCNFLTKRAWVRQQCTLVVAKDSNISHYLNSWGYLVMIILAII